MAGTKKGVIGGKGSTRKGTGRGGTRGAGKGTAKPRVHTGGQPPAK